MTSVTLARSLVRRTLNKQLFGIRSHSPRSRMPCSRTEVDAPLHQLHLPATSKNSRLVGVGTTRVTKPAVSRLLSELQRLFAQPQNTLFFLFLIRCTVCLYGM